MPPLSSKPATTSGFGPIRWEPERRAPYPFLHTEFNEEDPQFSPDGRWMAYRSNESGRAEIYSDAFPDPGPKKQGSAGGNWPRLRPDGRELFYFAADDRMMAAKVSTSAGHREVQKADRSPATTFPPMASGSSSSSLWRTKAERG